ncbi:hypothetical protein BDR22DRAFT_233106 [Usnea florida]
MFLEPRNGWVGSSSSSVAFQSIEPYIVTFFSVFFRCFSRCFLVASRASAPFLVPILSQRHCLYFNDRGSQLDAAWPSTVLQHLPCLTKYHIYIYTAMDAEGTSPCHPAEGLMPSRAEGGSNTFIQCNYPWQWLFSFFFSFVAMQTLSGEAKNTEHSGNIYIFLSAKISLQEEASGDSTNHRD